MKSIYQSYFKKIMLTSQFCPNCFSLCNYLLCIIFFLTSCNKFVEIPPPVTELVTASVFNDNASATAAELNIYTQMQQPGESYLMAQRNGLLSDELKNYSTSPYLIQYYTNDLFAKNTPGPWRSAFNYIYQANAIIEGLQYYSGVTSAVKQQLTAESKFVRAFWNFYLTNLYGDVPLVTSTDYSINNALYRTPQIQVYQQIVADLKDAENDLNDNYVDVSDTTITSDRVRPTKWAAASLLARTYLYRSNWDSAESQATIVINNTSLFSLVASLDSVFLANSSEAIWQLGTPLPAGNGATPDGSGFILISQPQTGNANSSTISTQLLNSFEINDNRKISWIGSYKTSTAPFVTYYFPYKYKVYYSSEVTEYTMVLRLAEQYLIRAEARAHQNNLAGAASDLNIIRNRAGLPNTSAVTQADLLTAILHERQVELFTEWGHRWFDLIRTGNANSVMGIVTPLKGGTWSSDEHQLLYPIPQSELSKNSNLIQNPGYY
jgi:starch-binding outer membrane protein, SusD/RagB family